MGELSNDEGPLIQMNEENAANENEDSLSQQVRHYSNGLIQVSICVCSSVEQIRLLFHMQMCPSVNFSKPLFTDL